MPILRQSRGAHPAPHPTGAVLIDVDGSCGALIVIGRRELCGRECFSRGSDDREQHVWFLERELPGGFVVAAVFARLPEDCYEVWVQGEPDRAWIAVEAGGVVEQAWPPGSA